MFLAKGELQNDILSLEDKKEPLDSKLARLKSTDTTSEHKSSKPKGTKKELFWENSSHCFKIRFFPGKHFTVMFSWEVFSVDE